MLLRRAWLVVVALVAALVLPASSQSSLTLHISAETGASGEITHTWQIWCYVEGADAAAVDRVDIYAFMAAYPDEEPYFIASVVPGAATSGTRRSCSMGGANPLPGGYYRLRARAHNGATDTYTTATSEFTFRVWSGATDFTGNVNPDLVLHEPATGFIKIWNMSGHRVAAEKPFTVVNSSGNYVPVGIPDGWRLVGTGDWRQDERRPVSLSQGGGPDLLLQHDGGWLWLWEMDRWIRNNIRTTRYLEPSHPGDARWHVEATADLNHDTWPDLIMRHQATGDLQVWYMRYQQRIGTATLEPSRVRDTNWKIVGAADMNHDTWADLVWHHQTEGTLMVLFMNGATMIGSDYLDPWRVWDTNWKVQSVVDLNNDSWPDLVWQHAGNNLGQVWFMRRNRLIGSEYISAGNSPYVPPGWQIAGPK